MRTKKWTEVASKAVCPWVAQSLATSVILGRYRIHPSTTNRMAKIWHGERTADAGQYHGGHPMGGGFIDSPYSAPPPVSSGHPTLDPGVAYFVRVCGFTFEFWSLSQIEVALRFYKDKVHPSKRKSTWGEHDVTQRWYERLPQYLQENGKRERVVKALELALRQFRDRA